jgi:hypothetical protein
MLRNPGIDVEQVPEISQVPAISLGVISFVHFWRVLLFRCLMFDVFVFFCRGFMLRER